MNIVSIQIRCYCNKYTLLFVPIIIHIPTKWNLKTMTEKNDQKILQLVYLSNRLVALSVHEVLC